MEMNIHLSDLLFGYLYCMSPLNRPRCVVYQGCNYVNRPTVVCKQRRNTSEASGDKLYPESLGPRFPASSVVMPTPGFRCNRLELFALAIIYRSEIIQRITKYNNDSFLLRYPRYLPLPPAAAWSPQAAVPSLPHSSS